MQTASSNPVARAGKLEKRIDRVNALQTGGMSSAIAKITNAMQSIASEDSTETVREFAERFGIVEKSSFSHSDGILLHEFLVTLYESKNGIPLMHVDFRVMGEETDQVRSFSTLLQDRKEFDLIKAAIDYREELTAEQSSNSEKWKGERVSLPLSTLFNADEPATDTHSEPHFVTEFPFPFVPKIVRLSKDEAFTKAEIDDISYDIRQTIRGYEARKVTLADAVKADVQAEGANATKH